MARAWRIEYDGALYHVLSRGNEQQDIFRDDQDRTRFLESTGEMSEHFDIDIFAYVLMGNHYHLLLKTNRSNLSKGMQWLGLAYNREGLTRIVNLLLNPEYGVIRDKSEITAVGHRVVHGGEAFKAPTIVDEGAIAAIKKISPGPAA